ncbi:MAG: hypothetical protein OCC46_15050 [Pseudodesulfovibrio sp.]
MKRCIPVIFCLILVVAFAATPAQADDQKPFFVHFVVVSKTMPDGTDAGPALLSFKAEAIKLAGGYTELGQSRGGSLVDGKVQDQENISFVIGASKDISKELKEMTKRLFKGDGAFILAWPGKVMF